MANVQSITGSVVTAQTLFQTEPQYQLGVWADVIDGHRKAGPCRSFL